MTISAAQRAILELVWAGVGPARIRELLEAHGTPEQAVAAGPREWRRRGGRAERRPPHPLEDELTLVAQRGVRLLTLVDADYPPALRTIHDPPPVLYVWGTLVPEDAAAVAIVGSRLATLQGAAVAERLGRELAAHGLTVVSGLARGIDGAAHRGALAAGGRTLAVLGGGLDRLFPPDHAALAQQIAAQGAVLSEFPMTMPPLAEQFPRRNRVLSGLSLGVVVVEAAGRSGALITARCALEQGREVFAVPGPAGAPQSRGTHQLLRDGAGLVESAEDVLAALQQPLARCLTALRRQAPSAPGPRPAPRLTAEETPVYARLSTEPVGADRLTAQTGVPPARLLPLLLALELKGVVRQVAGQQFVRVAP